VGGWDTFGTERIGHDAAGDKTAVAGDQEKIRGRGLTT